MEPDTFLDNNNIFLIIIMIEGWKVSVVNQTCHFWNEKSPLNISGLTYFIFNLSTFHHVFYVNIQYPSFEHKVYILIH